MSKFRLIAGKKFKEEKFRKSCKNINLSFDGLLAMCAMMVLSKTSNGGWIADNIEDRMKKDEVIETFADAFEMLTEGEEGTLEELIKQDVYLKAGFQIVSNKGGTAEDVRRALRQEKRKETKILLTFDEAIGILLFERGKLLPMFFGGVEQELRERISGEILEKWNL